MSWLVLLVVAAAAFGLWGLRHATSASAYFAASRCAGPVLAGLGGTAAGLSAFVFVGGPGLFAQVGIASLWIILSAPLTGALQCWLVGEPVVTMAARHGCITVPELLAARYGRGWPQGLAAVAIILGGIATLAVQIRGVAILSDVLLDTPGPVVAVVTVAATVAYTAAGGMRAGLLAEAAQGLVMAVAAVTIAGAAVLSAGGPGAAVVTIAERRPELLEAWGAGGPEVVLGWFLLFALGTCGQPHYLQKFLMLRDARALRWLPAVSTGALVSVLTVWVGVGLGGSALWLSGDLELAHPDELTPAFLRSCDQPWLVGLAVVAVLAAVMSTAATLLNMVAAAVVRDLPAALGAQPSPRLFAARLATALAGAAAAALALWSERPLVVLGIVGWGTFTAALLPALAVGLNWPGASRRGAVAAIAVGLAVQLTLEGLRSTGSPLGPWEPGLAGAAIGTLALVALSTCRAHTDGGDSVSVERE